MAFKRGWLREASGVRVEHYPCPHPLQSVDLSVPATGVLHTIEGSLESGLSVFRQHFAPTFTVGGKRILQHMPLGTMASALVHDYPPPTNGWARVQIEVEGHSQTTPWLFPEPTLDTLARLMATLAEVAEIPLRRPFPDWMPPQPWATENFARRHAGVWGRYAGWYGHVEVPGNSHWDPGALQWFKLLQRANAHRKIKPGPVRQWPRPKKIPRVAAHYVWRHGLPYTEFGHD